MSEVSPPNHVAPSENGVQKHITSVGGEGRRRERIPLTGDARGKLTAVWAG